MSERLHETRGLETRSLAAEEKVEVQDTQLTEGRQRVSELDEELSILNQESRNHQAETEASQQDKEDLNSQLEERRRLAAGLDLQLSARTQEISNLQQQKSEAEGVTAALKSQTDETAQRIEDLERQVSDRSQALQGLQNRTETAEKYRKRLTSLYFQLTNQVEEASKQATELENQLSQRTAEIEELTQQAEATEKIQSKPVEQPKRALRSSERRRFGPRVGSDEQGQDDNGATDEIKRNGNGLGGLLKRLFGGSRVANAGDDAPKKPVPIAAPVPVGPSETPATGVRSISITPPAPPEDEPYKLPRFLSEEPPSD